MERGNTKQYPLQKFTGRKAVSASRGERADEEEENMDEKTTAKRSGMFRLTTSSNIPPSTTATGERNTRHDPVQREEHLTDEDWAIMSGGKLLGLDTTQVPKPQATGEVAFCHLHDLPGNRRGEPPPQDSRVQWRRR